MYNQKLLEEKEDELRRQSMAKEREQRYLEDLRTQIDNNKCSKQMRDQQTRKQVAMSSLLYTKEELEQMRCMECEKVYPSNQLSKNRDGICLHEEEHQHTWH